MTDTTSRGLRLMAIHAHPDDEASKGAATTAKYVDQGAEVMVVTCTGGERGDVLNPRLAHDPEVLANIHDVRREEMAKAAEILGASHAWLEYEDSGFPDSLQDFQASPDDVLPAGCFALQDVKEAALRLVEHIRRFRPHVLTTYDENGGYPHPDHIMCHKVSMAAYEMAGDPSVETGDLPPWQPVKIYYNGQFKTRVKSMHEGLLERGLESPYTEFFERIKGTPSRDVHAIIVCGKYFEIGDDALRAHATQVDPDGFFFAVSPDLRREIWPTEEFELGHSQQREPDTTDDLFSGIRGTSLVETGWVQQR